MESLDLKIGRNALCPCGSGKKYKKCCLHQEKTPRSEINTDFLKNKQSYFEHIHPVAEQIKEIIQKYNFRDVAIAVFCLNSWRRNRSALSQGLSLHAALVSCSSFGTQSIKSYCELEKFYSEIAPFTKITSREDYIIDDFGEVFINQGGKAYSVITGTGYQQTYSVMRYMQQLALLCNRNEELNTILEYVNTILELVKDANTPESNYTITFELPSEKFWTSVNELFRCKLFQEQVGLVFKIMGHQFGPIEMRHFVQKETEIFPLFNTSILVDYYKHLLLEAPLETKENHIPQTILSLVEHSFNFSSKSPHNVFINPVIMDRETNKRIISNGLLFVGCEKNNLLFAIYKSSFQDEQQIHAIAQEVIRLNRLKKLRIVERYHRKDLPGAYGIDVVENCQITYMIVNSFTDVTQQGCFLGNNIQEFECTALDAICLLGFSTGLGEIIDFIRYANNDQTNLFTFGGTSNYFFAWKEANRCIASGAIEYDQIVIDYDRTDAYIYSYFKETLSEFPHNSLKLFTDPLNWIVENGRFGYSQIQHKGHGFGGEIKALSSNTVIFLAHSMDFFTLEDFEQKMHTALKTIDELNQRLCLRYSDLISEIEILKGKTLELLFIPWRYAVQYYADSFLNDPSRRFAFSDAYVEEDSIIIRYSVDPTVIMSAIQSATNREIENTYFTELLQPLSRYAPESYQELKAKLMAHLILKKTVGVFTVEQYYYFSNKTVNVDISEIEFTRARKEIAKVCFDAGVEPAEYRGKAATNAIRKMQSSVVKVFEEYISRYDRYELHKKALSYHAIQLHGCIINLKRYTAFTDLDEEVQREFEKETIAIREDYRRYARTAEYLLESNLAIEHLECKKNISQENFGFLLAFADWLVILQDAADTCFHTDFDLKISVDDEYRVDTILDESMLEKYGELISRKYSVKDYPIKDDATDEDFFKRAIDAFREDTGLDMKALIFLIEYMQLKSIQENTAVEVYPNVFEIEKSILTQKLNEILKEESIDLSQTNLFLQFLTLNPSALKTIKGRQHEVLPVWERENRDNRFNVKPIIEEGERYIFSPVSINRVLELWKSGITEWYLPYEIGLSKLMIVVKEWKKRYEDEMVQNISQLFYDAEFDISIPEVELIRRFPKDNYPKELGDYDVIAISRKKHEIWIIESKVLQKVGSIYEDQMQQKSFFFQHKDDEKFQRRIDYVTCNLPKILTSFGIEVEKYNIVSYMVTNKLFAARYKKLQFSIITYSELRQMLFDTTGDAK